MNTKILFKINLILPLFFISSCNVLDEQPFTQNETENYFQDSNDAIDGLTSAYSRLKSGNGYYKQKYLSTIFAASDQGLSTFLLNNFKNGTVTSTDPNIDTIWKDIYVAIRDANMVIANVPGIDMDEELKSRIVGEAKFLRALHYFNLVRCFGEVPLRTEPVTAEAISEGLPLSPIVDIYNLIIEDLQYASLNCSNRAQIDIGRATKSSSYALLAKVYLRIASCKQTALGLMNVGSSGTSNDGINGNIDYLQFQESPAYYYESAKNSCDDALLDSGFSLVGNLDDWTAIFDPNNGNSPEMLFDIQGSNEIGQGTAVSNLFTPRNSGLSGTGFGGSNKLKGKFINNYLDKSDPRFQNTIIKEYQNSSRLFEINNGSTGYFSTPFNPELNAYTLWQVWTSKYIDSNATNPYDSRQNWHVIRLADVYLMRAEALAELNQNPILANDDINILRNRVGQTDIDFSSYSMSDFRTALLKERSVELYMEGHRFFDLTRFGVYNEYCYTVLNGIGGNTDGSRQADDYTWPTPIFEITANSNIN